MFELPDLSKERPLEKSIERKACEHAESRGWWVRKFKSPGRRGVPDRIFARGKETFWIEFKRPGETLSKEQEREIAYMRKHGLTVYVCDNLDDAKRVIDVGSL